MKKFRATNDLVMFTSKTIESGKIQVNGGSKTTDIKVWLLSSKWKFIEFIFNAIRSKVIFGGGQGSSLSIIYPDNLIIAFKNSQLTTEQSQNNYEINQHGTNQTALVGKTQGRQKAVTNRKGSGLK